MGTRIDDLEKNIADLMTQAGVDGPEKWCSWILETFSLNIFFSFILYQILICIPVLLKNYTSIFIKSYLKYMCAWIKVKSLTLFIVFEKDFITALRNLQLQKEFHEYNYILSLFPFIVFITCIWGFVIYKVFHFYWLWGLSQTLLQWVLQK